MLHPPLFKGIAMNDNQESRVRALELEVRRLSTLIASRETAEESAPAAGAEPVRRVTLDQPSSRRRVVRNTALATGGLLAGSTLLAKPALANDPFDLTLGGSKTTTGLTGGSSSHATGGAAFMFQAGTVYGPGSAAFPCALAGWTTLTGKPHGVYGYTTQAGYALIGYGAGGTSSGAYLYGGRANAYLVPSGPAAPSRTDAHSTGELVADGLGNLWFCVGAGSPGTWRKIAGPASAGTFHPLTPGRVYDSRVAQPLPGALNGGSSKTISVANRRNTSTGAVVEANFVPAGASAVFCNVTVIGLTNSGYLTVNPGGVLTVGASTVHWAAPGNVVDNGIAAKLNGNRQLTIVASGGGSTHFLIDVMGYYL